MLQSYLPIYKLAYELEGMRHIAEVYTSRTYGGIDDLYLQQFAKLLRSVERVCLEFDLTHTADLARSAAKRVPSNFGEMLATINSLDDSLANQLEKEGVLRIPPERKTYYERDHLFGKKVADAFPSCERDITRAGDCYALGQEDACVHHLMLVLERGLNALAARLTIPYRPSGWQTVINAVTGKLNQLPKGDERDFLIEVNSQFGFLKNAYRNHSEHAHDDPYDLEKALSIFNHVRDFMKALEKGGLSEAD